MLTGRFESSKPFYLNIYVEFYWLFKIQYISYFLAFVMPFLTLAFDILVEKRKIMVFIKLHVLKNIK